MSTFEIPTGPALSPRSLAYNVPREEACRGKRRITSLRRGSLAYDREKGGMTLEWANNEKFQEWLAAEESDKSIELIVSHTDKSADSQVWRERCVFRCSHEFTGGKVNYQKKTQWERKIPSKKTSCQCCLTIKLYPETESILGKYEQQHNHPVGDDNLRFTRLSGKIRNLVMDMVYTGIDSHVIVESQITHCVAELTSGYRLVEAHTRVLQTDRSRLLYHNA